MKISIVMAYHNRSSQLWTTLKSIRRQERNVEIIIVDDASEDSQRASNVASSFPGMDINCIFLPMKDKTWINPCVPFNVGFREATGSLILIQSPECMHIGRTLDYAATNRSDNSYLTFSCYNLPKCSHEFISALKNKSDNVLVNEVRNRVELDDPANDSNTHREEGCWFNHPTYCPKNYHFLSAISNENLEDLGGFDERYANGYCWDDNEFLWRIHQKGLHVITVPPGQGYVAHQWHEHGPLSGGCPEWHRNKGLFEQVTKCSSTYKVNLLDS